MRPFAPLRNTVGMMIVILFGFCLLGSAQEVFYTVEYSSRPASPPSLTPVFMSSYKGFQNVYVVSDNWYYASRERIDACEADAFIIPGGSTSDVPFYDGRLDSYVDLLRDPGRPTIGFCAGLQFLCMAQGGICAYRSGESGNMTARIIQNDNIFNGAPNPYTDRASHSMSIADPPDEFEILATTRTCYVTFIKHLTMPLYGSQLHIESMNNAQSAGPAILSNFRNVVMQRPFHGIARASRIPGKAGSARLHWWRAKTDDPVMYNIYYAAEGDDINYAEPYDTSSALNYEIDGLDAGQQYRFAVRAVTEAFSDTNRNEYPLQPDGHRMITFQNGLAIGDEVYDACEATVICDEYPDCNFGKVGAPGKGQLYWWDSGLVQFPGLENYLQGKQVVSARLTYLFVGGVAWNTDSNHVAEIGIFRVRKPWNEGQNYTLVEADSGGVTWNAAQHGQLTWEVPGCKGATDRVPEPIAEFTIRGDGQGIAFDGTVDLPPEIVQLWIDHPDSNCGLLYEKVDSYPGGRYFWFEDNERDWFMLRPRLVVEYIDGSQSGITAETVPFADRIELLSNFPNPFNNSTQIFYRLAQSGHVQLQLFDLLGREQMTLVNASQPAGSHQVALNAHSLPGGVYFYRIVSGTESQTGKMLLLK